MARWRDLCLLTCVRQPQHVGDALLGPEGLAATRHAEHARPRRSAERLCRMVDPDSKLLDHWSPLGLHRLVERRVQRHRDGAAVLIPHGYRVVVVLGTSEDLLVEEKARLVESMSRMTRVDVVSRTVVAVVQVCGSTT